MTYSFVSPPNAGRFVLSNATLPAAAVSGYAAPAEEGLVRADIVVADGLVSAVLPPGEAPADYARSDLKGGMAWPCFVDAHTHLDKGHIWSRNANLDGTFMGALEAVRVVGRRIGPPQTSECGWNSRYAPPTPTAPASSARISILSLRSTGFPSMSSTTCGMPGRIGLHCKLSRSFP
ncbi:hypothetical protein AJ87_39355 [Rhizobium yanglingense]|nr:hypothetical protein AJ87_39355 [Rhizobium yanglingense]